MVIKRNGPVSLFIFLCISNGVHFWLKISGNDGMFFCHRKSVHFPVGLSVPIKKRANSETMKTTAMKTSLLLVLGHLTDKRYRVALPLRYLTAL